MLGRSVAWLTVFFALTIGAVDGGSVVLTKMTVPDDTRSTGLVAASAVGGEPVDRRAVVTAYLAAQDEGTDHSLAISREDFTLFRDGRVTLTATRTAPTLMFHRLPWLRDATVVSTTATVTPLPYS